MVSMACPFFRLLRTVGAEKPEPPLADAGAPPAETGEARLNRVEKEQCHLRFMVRRAIAVGAGILFLSQLLVLSFFSTHEEVAVGSDPQKKPEGRFGSLYAEQLWLRPKPGTACLVQADHNATARFALLADREGACKLEFSDREGTVRIGMTCPDNEGPQIALFDDLKQMRARLTLTSAGHPALMLCDEIGRGRALLMLENQRPCLRLLDENLNPLSVRPER
jgi:hypothetical protein